MGTADAGEAIRARHDVVCEPAAVARTLAVYVR
jgi:hypothetical protein